MKIKHSKYKNTGILFELLVRQITADTLKGGDSPAIDILKKYFVKSELGREYKLYESFLKSKTISEGHASILINTILESSQRLNRTRLRKEKYNLVNEIKTHYDINSFFSSQVKNYKEIASIYTLIESYNSETEVNPHHIVSNKVTLLEFLTKSKISESSVKEDIFQEYETYDKDLKVLTYKIILEKFNEKYSNLSGGQKVILKEFINSVDSTPSLRNFYNSKIIELKLSLNESVKVITDKVTKIKVTEISKLLVELDKTSKVSNDNLVDLLQYYELVNEIKNANGK